MLLLDDGTDVVVSYDVPPHGWDGLHGQRLRVEGTLVEAEPEGDGATLPLPHLHDVDAPLPVELVPPAR